MIADLSLKYDTLLACTVATPQELGASGRPFYANVRRDAVRI